MKLWLVSVNDDEFHLSSKEPKTPEFESCVAGSWSDHYERIRTEEDCGCGRHDDDDNDNQPYITACHKECSCDYVFCGSVFDFLGGQKKLERTYGKIKDGDVFEFELKLKQLWNAVEE